MKRWLIFVAFVLFGATAFLPVLANHDGIKINVEVEGAWLQSIGSDVVYIREYEVEAELDEGEATGHLLITLLDGFPPQQIGTTFEAPVQCIELIHDHSQPTDTITVFVASGPLVTNPPGFPPNLSGGAFYQTRVGLPNQTGLAGFFSTEDAFSQCQNAQAIFESASQSPNFWRLPVDGDSKMKIEIIETDVGS